MKSSHWFDALKAHSRVYLQPGAVAQATVGECAVIMGCTAQTAKKHMGKAVQEGKAAMCRVKKSGCIEQIIYEWSV